jgi:hypothetical protein
MTDFYLLHIDNMYIIYRICSVIEYADKFTPDNFLSRAV